METKENNYFLIKDFIDKDFVEFIQSYFFLRIRAGQAKLGDPQVANSYAFYGDPLSDTILQNSCDAIGKIVGKKVLPTYSYVRLYEKGAELVNHQDRPSCELSATLALGIPEGEEINPIYFSKNEDKSDAVKILLEPGDLCIYKGCDLWHWRPPFTQKWYLQAFLHYVYEDGSYTSTIYDYRPYLGMPEGSRRV